MPCLINILTGMIYLMASTSAFAQQTKVVKTFTRQSADISCSNNKRFSAVVRWSTAEGITIEKASVNNVNVSFSELSQASERLKKATDLTHLEMWCSGDRDGGLNIYYNEKNGDHVDSLRLGIQIHDKHIILDKNSGLVGG